MRLIDADALLKSAGIFEIKMAARGCGKSILHLAKAWLFNEVNKAPTIDAVSVVRCKDCIHGTAFGEDFNCRFYPEWYWFKGDHFCADGERREEMTDKMSFEELREMLLYRRIVKWNGNTITLDNGLEISIEETEQDCCACAEGEFTDVVLDAAITNVGNIEYEPWDTEDDKWSHGEFGCNATVTIMHNRNVICKAHGRADAGNGGYYYSIASFVVKIPSLGVKVCHFVGSEDGRDA